MYMIYILINKNYIFQKQLRPKRVKLHEQKEFVFHLYILCVCKFQKDRSRSVYRVQITASEANCSLNRIVFIIASKNPN